MMFVWGRYMYLPRYLWYLPDWCGESGRTASGFSCEMRENYPKYQNVPLGNGRLCCGE